MRCCSVIVCCILLCVGSHTALANSVTLVVDDLPLVSETPAQLIGGLTMVPLRVLTEALGCDVNWDPDTQIIRVVYKSLQIRLCIGQKVAFANDRAVSIDTEPLIINGRTMVPLRFISESLGSNVDWDDISKTASLHSLPSSMSIAGFYALGDQATSSWTDLFGLPYPKSSVGNTDMVDRVLLGWYCLDDAGNLTDNSPTGWRRPDGWEDVLSTARRSGLTIDMVVHATDSDGTLSAILSDSSAQQQLVELLVQTAVNYDGINLDFEGLGLSERGQQLIVVQEQFTGFVTLLRQALVPMNKTLTLTLHAPNSAYQGYDYQALGEVSDSIIVMAYDYGPKPEPIDKVKEAIESAVAEVRSARLYLGLSAPYETSASLVSKICLAKRNKLAGIAIWRLGVVTQEQWASIRQLILARADRE